MSEEKKPKKFNRFKKKVESHGELSVEDWEKLNKEFFGEENASWCSRSETDDDEFDENGEPRELEF